MGANWFRRRTEIDKCIAVDPRDHLIPVGKTNANDNSFAMAA